VPIVRASLQQVSNSARRIFEVTGSVHAPEACQIRREHLGPVRAEIDVGEPDRAHDLGVRFIVQARHLMVNVEPAAADERGVHEIVVAVAVAVVRGRVARADRDDAGARESVEHLEQRDIADPMSSTITTPGASRTSACAICRDTCSAESLKYPPAHSLAIEHAAVVLALPCGP
jgi:hypothetical protein